MRDHDGDVPVRVIIICLLALGCSPGLAFGQMTLAGVGLSGVDTGGTAADVYSFTPRSLGTASSCASQTCSVVVTGRVCEKCTIDSCTSVAEADDVELGIWEPGGGCSGAQRTVVLGAGGRGGGFYGSETNSLQVIADLQAACFRVVELKFSQPTGSSLSAQGWTIGASGDTGGHHELACRWATAGHHVLTDHLNGSLLCASGNSIGSTGVAAWLQYYNGESDLAYALFTAGPIPTRPDLGCAQTELTIATGSESNYGMPQGTGKRFMDATYGYLTDDGGGPCASWPGTAAQQQAIIDDSMDGQDGDFNYSTALEFMYGSNDSASNCTTGNCSNAPNLQSRWTQRLIANGMSFNVTEVTGGNHTMMDTAAGASAISAAIIAGCL